MAPAEDAPFPLEPYFEVCKVRPAHFEGFGMGMRCREAVKAGEELLTVSLERCWTAEATRRCPQISALGEEIMEAISDATLIALHILVTKALGPAAEDVRREHVAVLQAAKYENLLDWSEEDLRMLQGSKWAMVAPACKQDIEEEFAELQEVIGDFLAAHGIDLAGFLWAQKALISRSVQFFMEDGSLLYMLGPGQDLFNHSVDVPIGNDDVNLKRSDGGELQLAIRAYRDFQEGEQAFYSYSPSSNGRLLLMAGFVLPENPFDTVELCITLPVTAESLPFYLQLAEGLATGVRKPGSAFVEETKQEFLETLPPGEDPPTEVALHVNLSLSDVAGQLERALAFVRLGHLCQGGKAPSREALNFADGDPSCQVRARKQLLGCLEGMFKGYAREIEEDEAELPAAEAAAAAAPEGGRERRRLSALRVLVGEKRIFQCALAYLSIARPEKAREYLGLSGK